jgi:hypothetical protein
MVTSSNWNAFTVGPRGGICLGELWVAAATEAEVKPMPPSAEILRNSRRRMDPTMLEAGGLWQNESNPAIRRTCTRRMPGARVPEIGISQRLTPVWLT